MIRYVNSIGPELQKGVIPPFIAEKDAVTAYARQRGEPEGLHIYRDGEHHYSYTSRQVTSLERFCSPLLFSGS